MEHARWRNVRSRRPLTERRWAKVSSVLSRFAELPSAICFQIENNNSDPTAYYCHPQELMCVCVGVYKVNYRPPAMTYGAETWTLTKEAQNKLAAAQTKMERSMLNITYKDRKTNIWSLACHPLETIYDKKRRQGRPAKRWRDDLDKYQPNHVVQDCKPHCAGSTGVPSYQRYQQV